MKKSQKTGQHREAEGQAAPGEGARDTYAARGFFEGLRPCADK